MRMAWRHAEWFDCQQVHDLTPRALDLMNSRTLGKKQQHCVTHDKDEVGDMWDHIAVAAWLTDYI